MCLLLVFLLFAILFYPSLGFNHWVVTEDGKIEYQAASPFNLRQPFDLMAFMKQEERVSILKELKEELIEYKNEFEMLKEFNSFDDSFLASEPQCKNVKLISSYDLHVSTILPLEHKGIRLMEHLDLSSSSLPGEPFCSISPLPFSMYALEHLEGVQVRRSLVAPPEKSVLASVDMRLEVFGSLVHHALKMNSTSWVLLDLATLYWRARGNPYHALECVRRALHYSPTYVMDVALLNLANVLHRTQHSTDALVPLKVALTLAPDVNVLHHTLGNVYAALNLLNESVNSFERCVQLDPNGETTRALYMGALCEMRVELISQERTRKLGDTQKKLDQFYENMELVQKLQHPISSTEPQGLQRKHKKTKVSPKSDSPAITAVPVTDPTPPPPPSNANEKATQVIFDTTVEEDLERLMSEKSSAGVPNNLTDSKGSQVSSEGESIGQSNSSDRDKVRSHNLRLVLKPLPIEDDEDMMESETSTEPLYLDGVTDDSQSSGCKLSSSVPSVEMCFKSFFQAFSKGWCDSFCMDDTSSPAASANVCALTELQEKHYSQRMADIQTGYSEGESCQGHCQTVQENHSSGRSRPRLKLVTIEDDPADDVSLDFSPNVQETSIFDHIEHTETDTHKEAPSTSSQSDYPLSYHSLEFLPYNPLPEQLERVIFPIRTNPLASYDDPYWPSKGPCLSLVQEVRDNPHIASFPGTFLPPSARGADMSRLFATGSDKVPSIVWEEPRCTDIVELPYSMAAMDHLLPVADRRVLNVSQTMKENSLKRVLVDTVAGGGEDKLSFEESAHQTYAAMLQVGPQWALFNIASLYWRVAGDPENALECLRRGIHFAPNKSRDVGLMGMANVLHRLGFLNEAITAARAALDINTESPVGHYTIAGIYLSLRDYVAASLHLRAALHISEFSEALLSLKLIRCSIKFKGEQSFLRQKMHENEEEMRHEEQARLIEELKDVVLNGKKIEQKSLPPLVVENIEPPEIPEMKVQDMLSSAFTGENAIRYLTSLALLSRARTKQKEVFESSNVQDTSKDEQLVVPDTQQLDVSESGQSSSHESVNDSRTDYLKENATSVVPPLDSQRQTNTSHTSEKMSDNKDTQANANRNTDKILESSVDDKNDGKSIDPDIEKLLDKAATAINNNQSPVPQKTPPKVKSKRKTHDQIREEEIHRRFPGTRPWPTMEECEEKPPPKKLIFTSTWLSITAKGVRVKEFIDFDSPLEHYPLLPYCHNDFDQSRKTLSHLTGMFAHPLTQYKPEKGLQEVLCNMDGNRRSLEEMATRIKIALAKHPDSWVVSNIAALYWRIVGQGQLAIKCLKHALYFSDDNVRDVALVSLSNVLYRSGFDMDALAVIHMSLEASPTLVVTHFTMANILATQGFYVDASGFYESTLHYQPQFQPAADRLKSVRCLILLARKQYEEERKKELEDKP